VPKQAHGDVSACRAVIVGVLRRAEPCSWGCFGVPSPAREDGTEVSYSIAAAIGSNFSGAAMLVASRGMGNLCS